MHPFPWIKRDAGKGGDRVDKGMGGEKRVDNGIGGDERIWKRNKGNT